MAKQRAPLSLDLDNKWSYLKTHGDESWTGFPSYLETVVPRALGLLAERGWSVTWFIVGKDAEVQSNQDVLRSIADAGHEIGNHSYLHEPWLHQYSRADLVADIGRAHDAIAKATGSTPLGFRGPGFSLSETTLEVLKALGYEYDATTFPNILNPLSRLYYLRTSNLSPEEKERRKALFGTTRDALRSNRPYRWILNGGADAITEVPVTTMPMFRVPIHFSYVIWLGGKSRFLAMAYWRLALRMCRLAGTIPSLLLHPLDFLGSDDEPDLGFFPGMDIEYSKKAQLLDELLDIWDTHYTTVPIGEYAAALGGLETRKPDLLRATD